MRTFTLLGLSAAILQGVAATGGGWRDQAEYPCPQNIKNDCTADEENGFDWSDLNEGTFNTYRGYNFNGWDCASKLGKRNLEGRTFNDKCIETDLTSNSFSNEISCDKSFSIGQLDISVDLETDVEFYYGMPDGTTCKQTKRCGVEGTTVTNDQCGGANTVKVKLPANSGGTTCKLGVHKVSFECGTTTTSVPVPTTTIPTVTASGPAVITSSVTTSNVQLTLITSAVASTTTSTTESCTTPSDCTGTTCTMPAGCTSTTGTVQSTYITSSAVSTTTSTNTCTIPSDCTGGSCIMPAGCTSITTGNQSTTTISYTIPSPINTCTIPSDCYGSTCTMPTGCISSTDVLTSTQASTETYTVPIDYAGSTCTMPADCLSTTGGVGLGSASSTLYTVTTSTIEIKPTSVGSFVSTSTAPIDTCTIPSDCAGGSCVMPAGCTSTLTGGIQLTTTTSYAITASINTCTIPSDCYGATCAMPAGCSSVTGPATSSGSSTTFATDSTLTSATEVASTIVSTGVTSATAGGSSTSSIGLAGNTTIGNGSSISSTGSSTIAAVFTTTNSAAVPAVTMPSTECPDVLPRCLKTWIFITSCTDTADPTCFCPEEEFVNKVVDCLSSWGADDSEVASSIEYFLGLCQSFIPQNPAIVTAIPPTITLPPPSPNVPVQTIIRTITTVVPCEPTTIAAGSSPGSVVSFTTSSLTMTATIPQVALVVTATDATLVYPTPYVDAVAAPAPAGGVATSVPATTTASAIQKTSSPAVQTAVITYAGVFDTRTTLMTYPAAPSANATRNMATPSPSSISLFTGAASSIVPATFIAMLGAAVAVLFQL